MTALKIIALILGLAFTLFGYFILFRGKYALINGFDEAFKAGHTTKAYARRVGMVEFILGLILMLAGILFILFD